MVSVMNKSIRLMLYLESRKLYFFSRALQITNRIIFACDIPRTIKLGKNSIFAHSGLGVVIHQKAIIGENVKIMQGVTIGGRGNEKGVPIIGDNVLIGSNSTLLGNIKIANDVKIGSNTLILKDVPSGVTIVGNPARIVKGGSK